MYRVNVFVEPHYPLKRAQLSRACIKALEYMKVNGNVEVAISIIGDRKMKKMNREFRGIDKPTDILAFPYILQSSHSKDFVTPPTQKYLNLGELLISYPQLLERAVKENTLVDEMSDLLVVHGVLHLLGLDHEKPEEAKAMEKQEDQILSSLKPQVIPEIIK